MDEDERYLWELQGYLRIRGALPPSLLAELNANVGKAPVPPREFEKGARAANGEGVPRRVDINGMLGWDQPLAQPFRELLDHPPVSSRLDDILGHGHRLDHSPVCITMGKGMGGGGLHGGGADRASLINSSFFKAGQFYTGMVVVVFFLAPEGPGDGGLGIIRGSHKAELPMPKSIRGQVGSGKFTSNLPLLVISGPISDRLLVIAGKTGAMASGPSDTFLDAVTEIHVDAGDCVIFAEACSHLTLPWQGDHQRRGNNTRNPRLPPPRETACDYRQS